MPLEILDLASFPVVLFSQLSLIRTCRMGYKDKWFGQVISQQPNR